MIKKCLFPAAGYGTRFLPATKAVPKEMLPILNKPLLQYGVEEARDAGIKDIAIVTGKGKRAIEDHFDSSPELEKLLKNSSKRYLCNEISDITERLNFCYARQKRMKGLGDAILTGQILIGDEPFAVHLADDLCTNDSKNVLEQLIDVYMKYKCTVIAIEEIDIKLSSSYGIIDGVKIQGEQNLYEVNDLIEKPDPINSPSNMAIIGRYILVPKIFNEIKKLKPGKNDEIQLTDALKNLAKTSKVLALKFEGKRFDCGNVKGFVEATNFFYEKSKSSL